MIIWTTSAMVWARTPTGCSPQLARLGSHPSTYPSGSGARITTSPSGATSASVGSSDCAIPNSTEQGEPKALRCPIKRDSLRQAGQVGHEAVGSSPTPATRRARRTKVQRALLHAQMRQLGRCLLPAWSRSVPLSGYRGGTERQVLSVSVRGDNSRWRLRPSPPAPYLFFLRVFSIAPAMSDACCP
jgi:hypothetical protein